MKTESKQEQYAAYLRNGGTMTLQQWENDSRYDPHLAGERITPEQQIENQKETIASLERKIESLERELLLEKCIDKTGDSGEIRPSWKPGQKHGEAALLDQIASLQKQLDDCLHSGQPLLRNDNLDSRIAHSINALFLPNKVWSDHKKEMQDHSVPWWYFRAFLFGATDLFNDYWTRPEFRTGLDMLNSIIDAVEHQDKPVTLNTLERYELGRGLFGYHDDLSEARYQATQCLISALLVVRANQDHEVIKMSVHQNDLDDMLVILKAMAFYQRIWIDAKPEEKKDQE